MRMIASLAAALTAVAMLSLAACNKPRPVVTPTPTAPATPTGEPNTNGHCHDGTVLRPNEQCP